MTTTCPWCDWITFGPQFAILPRLDRHKKTCSKRPKEDQ